MLQLERHTPSSTGHPNPVDVEMGFEIGVANHVVEGEWVWADNVTEIGVHHAVFGTSLEPPRYKCHHGMRFATIAGEAADEI